MKALLLYKHIKLLTTGGERTVPLKGNSSQIFTLAFYCKTPKFLIVPYLEHYIIEI